MMTDDDLALVHAASAELADVRQPFQFNVEPVAVLHLVALLQLAARHPGLPSTHALVARMIVDGARAYFEALGATHTVELIRRGDQPAYDAPVCANPTRRAH
jgi:hypothetical protein